MRCLSMLLCLLVFHGAAPAWTTDTFEDHFVDATLRIDYYHTGDAKTELVTVDHLYRYEGWSGSVSLLVDTVGPGTYRWSIYDAASQKLIFARNFDSYFKEYRTTARASRGMKRTFHESALVPFPKDSIRFALERRDPRGGLTEVFTIDVDPGDLSIITNEAPGPGVEVLRVVQSGDPHEKVDVVFVSEGYTGKQREKFERDLGRFTEVLLGKEPLRSRRDSFNVYGVFAPSAQSGIDEPLHASFKKTAVGATFNSMGSARYVLTEENEALHDLVSAVPCDAICIMVNHERYGGGGIYNFYCTFTTDNRWSEYVLVHEFGHSFFGLADEYYTSSTAYEDFYPAGVEPLEPNITALLDPGALKWRQLIAPGTPVPTPWEKEEFDSMDMAWQRKRQELVRLIASMRRRGAPVDSVLAMEKEYDRLDVEHSRRVQDFLASASHRGEVGAFEGAGYASKGLYRPMLNCIMFSKGAPEFCAVCREAMEKTIERYTAHEGEPKSGEAVAPRGH